MNRRANDAFQRNDFAQLPWLQNQLGNHLDPPSRGGGSFRWLQEGGRGWAGQKISNNIFQTGQLQHLYIEFRNESQMALLPRGNGGRNTRQCSHEGLWSVHN